MSQKSSGADFTPKPTPRPQVNFGKTKHELVADYGMSCHVKSPKHDCGGLLDVVVTRDDPPAQHVNIV